MKLDSMETMFHQHLRDLYDAEKRLVRALPKMAKNATSEELREALQNHVEVTRQQVSRLEQIFTKLGKKASAKQCAGMKGILEEGEEVMEQDGEATLLDLEIIAAGRKVEHYEMASYRALEAMAESMGDDEITELIRETLAEEEEADGILSGLSEQLMEEAASASEEDVEDMDEEDDDEEIEEAEEDEEAVTTPTRARKK